MIFNSMHEALMYAVYFAPRGKERLMALGHQIAQRYLSPDDKLIGLIGDAGAGKSLLINGMFPGLELSNDDEGMHARSLPLLQSRETGFFSSHTYHIDVQFQMAFSQIHVIAEAVRKAVESGKRVVVEHFDLLYPALSLNAEILIGIGEEVIVTRPNIFGPLPGDIAGIVFRSIKYRKMAHTAEDLVTKVLRGEMGVSCKFVHSDVRHGFVLETADRPDFDIAALERRVLELIRGSFSVEYQDDSHILLGGNRVMLCTGPRIHVANTSEIENFQLLHEFQFDSLSRTYALVGLVGSRKSTDISDLNKLSL